jgi:hypothetical protein
MWVDITSFLVLCLLYTVLRLLNNIMYLGSYFSSFFLADLLWYCSSSKGIPVKGGPRQSFIQQFVQEHADTIMRERELCIVYYRK